MKRIAITLKPTHACNMRCKHCYHASEGFATDQLKPEAAMKMLDVVSNEYDQISVSFHGGEPTLWGIDNIRCVLEHEKLILAQKPNVKFKNMIQTNALLLNKDWFDMFKEWDFVVGTSFDGPHNDDLRSNTETVYRNLKAMQATGVKFGTLCVETGKSIDSTLKTYEWFKREGINYKILALFMSGAAVDHVDLELDINVYVDHLAELYKVWLFDKDCNIMMRTCEDLLKVSDKLYCLQYGGTCLHQRICLNPDGKIYPCGRPYTDDFCLGHIDTFESVRAAFLTPAYQSIVQMHAKRIAQCKEKCKFYGVCNGGCISSAMLDGTFEKIDNTTCVRARRLLTAITEINTQVYAEFDNNDRLERFNPKALSIMKKSRAGEYDCSCCR